MGWPTSELFVEGLATGADPVSYADIYRDGVLQQANVLLAGGSVSVREDSGVRRSLSLSVADFIDYSTKDVRELLSPFGTEIHVRSGLRLSAGHEEIVPVGVFVLEESERSGWYAEQELKGADRALRLQEDRFLLPYNASSTKTVVETIIELIQQTLPAVEIFDLTFNKTRAANATWERDRWDCIENLAASIGAEVFFDPAGRVFIRPVQEITADTTPFWTIQGGEEVGVLADVSMGLSRDKVYNAVVAIGDQGTGAPPVTAIAWQTAGDLRWRPDFRKPRFYASPFIRTYQGAVSAATKMLARSAVYSRRMTVQVIPNPALDVDPVLIRQPDGVEEMRIARDFTLPLGVDGTMSIATRVGAQVAVTDNAETLS